MQYVGLQTQIWRNNFRSTLLLIGFPILLLAMDWLFLFYVVGREANINQVNIIFVESIPFIIIPVGIWFLIAWASHSSMIRKATSSQPLSRKENMRVYNLVENLCMSKGMKIPKIYVIDDDSLNAFASGLSQSTYSVSLSKGIIDKLNDQELEGVIAHELTHIRNKDVRLLVISVIFVGIFAFIAQMGFRMVAHGRFGKKNQGVVIAIFLIGLLGLLVSTLFRFSLSRKREYMADAGAVEMTKNAPALASALRKISGDPWIEAVTREDVAQMFIQHPTKKEKKKTISSFFNSLFATHPDINKRIAVLERF